MKLKSASQYALSIGLVLSLSACSISRKPLKDPASDTLGLGSKFDYRAEEQPKPISFRAYYDAANDKQAARNQIIFDVMSQIDDEYESNLVSLRFERASKDFAVTLTSITLTGVASQAGQSLANLLAAIDTGVKGVDAAFDQAYLEDKTNSLLFSAMRQARAEVRADIYQRLNNDVQIYPLEAAALDLNRYYRAGFVTTALIRLSEDSSSKAKEVEESAAEVLNNL